MKIGDKLWASLLFRSLFLQSVWNFERMQNIGFVFILMPVFKALYPDAQKRKEAVLRHLEFFNTNPYMITVVLGLVTSMEQNNSSDPSYNGRNVSLLKTNIAGPLAAIGDKFFWATWRPLCALLSSCLVLITYSLANSKVLWLPPLFFVLFYNLLVSIFRYWSLKLSCQYSDMIIKIVAGFEFKYVIDIARYSGMIFLFLVVLLYFLLFAGTLKLAMVFLFVFLVSGFFISYKNVPEIMIYALILFCIGLKWIKSIIC